MAACFASHVVVFSLAIWGSASTPCNSSRIVAPPIVEDTEGAYQLAEAINCSGGLFDVKWIGSVSIETPIYVLDGTTLSVTGGSDGLSSIDGSNETALFALVNGHLHLSKLTMANGTAEYGGAIMATNSVVTTSNCTFINNAAHYGGAVCLFHSIFEATKTLFVGNIASTNGGAILTRDSDVTVGRGGSFEENYALYGGAVCSERSAIYVSASTSFLGNTAHVGGGVYLWSSHFTANNAIFGGNNATGYGGAISAGNSSVTIANGAHFFHNSATSQGGAVEMYVNCSLLLSDAVEFDNNTAKFGGAISVEHSMFYVDGHVYFWRNAATDSGGAVYGAASDITVTGNALCEENDALYGAGMRLYNSCSLNVWGNITFLNNTAYQGAGMWISLHSDVAIHGSSTFEFNSANQGGGMVIYNATAQFSGGSTSSFYTNTAELTGGAILLFNAGEVTVAGNATFANNSAELGAGIAVSEGSYMVMVGKVVMADNIASSAGGAMYLDAPHEAHVNGTQFLGNQAMQSGGAIVAYSTGRGDNYAMFTDCVFEHNKASDAGGAFFVGGGFVHIHESSFHFNSAERAGGAVMVSGIVHFENCVLADNEALRGPAVYNAVTVWLESTDVCDNQLLCDVGSFLDWNPQQQQQQQYESCMSDTLVLMDGNDYVHYGHENKCCCQPYTNAQQVGKHDYYKQLSCCGSAYDTACDSCPVEDYDCTVPYYDIVQLCEPVLKHTTSRALDGTLETLRLEPGYWRSSNRSRDIRECYEADACVGGVQDLCASGYEGPFCAVCANGYTPGLGFTCIQCSGPRRKTTIALGIVVLVTLAIMVAVSFIFLGSSSALTPTGLHASCGQFLRALSRLKSAKATQAMKIVIVSWQIVTQFATVASITYPDVYAAFLRYVDVFNLNIFWILSAGCLIESNFYHGLIVSTMGPFAVVGCVRASHAISCSRCPAHDEEARAKVDQRHASVLFWMSLLIYATVSSSVFHTFACDDLDDGSSFLRSDHSLECYTTTHKVFMAYACVMVGVYPLGIPIFFAFVLYRNRASLKVGVGAAARTTDVTSFRELWEPYRPQVYFYEVVECLRRVLLSGVVVFIFPNTAGQVATSLLLAMFTAAVFMALDPYVSRWHTWLARISHAVVILSLYVAMLQKVDDMNDDSSSQHVFACVLVATNCGLILTVGVEAYGMFSVAVLEMRKPRASLSRSTTGTFRMNSVDSSARVMPLTESPPNALCEEMG